MRSRPMESLWRTGRRIFLQELTHFRRKHELRVNKIGVVKEIKIVFVTLSYLTHPPLTVASTTDSRIHHVKARPYPA